MSKNPRHRAGDEPVLAEAPVQEFDFIAPALQPETIAKPAATELAAAEPVETEPVETESVETEPVMATEATDNVAIVSGLFGGLDAPEPPRRTEPEGSLGDLVRPAFVPDAPVMQTWRDAPAPVAAREEPQEAQSGRRAANPSEESVFGV